MGYGFDKSGKLCCDNCGNSGGVRKMKCPWNYCPAVALCPSCRKSQKEVLTKAYHRGTGCEKGHLEFVRRETERKGLLEKGEYLRHSALWHPGKGIKVIFRNIEGDVKAFFMSQRTYEAIPLLQNACVNDYKKIGRVTKAKSLSLHNSH